jgi:hypothetical protein
MAAQYAGHGRVAHAGGAVLVVAHADGTADLFIAPEKVTPELRAHLGNAVRILPREDFVPR